MDYSKLKSRKHKWTEIALVLAVVIIFIFFLAIVGSKDTPETIQPSTPLADDDKGWPFANYIVAVLAIAVLYLLFGQNGSKYTTMTAYEVINFVANEVFFHENTVLDDQNTTVELGAPKETYVEFEKEARTFMLVDGEGIKEMYKGQAIKQIKNRKAENQIASDLAKVGISDYKDAVKMNRFDRTGEEE